MARDETGARSMVFTAYLDESGTHAGADVSAMAGFVSDARQWRKYEKRTGALFKRYGVETFHAIDVRRGHGDFKGWKVDRKIKFLDEFQHIINEVLEGGVSAFICAEDYEYYCGLHWPKKTRRDSKYTIMFRACLSHVVDVVGHIPQAKEPRLHVVLEDGHKKCRRRSAKLQMGTGSSYPSAPRASRTDFQQQKELSAARRCRSFCLHGLG
jgi:hypothetical protein